MDSLIRRSVLSNRTVTSIIYDILKSITNPGQCGFFELDHTTCMTWSKVTHLTWICALTQPDFNPTASIYDHLISAEAQGINCFTEAISC